MEINYIYIGDLIVGSLLTIIAIELAEFLDEILCKTKEEINKGKVKKSLLWFSFCIILSIVWLFSTKASNRHINSVVVAFFFTFTCVVLLKVYLKCLR